MNVVLDTNIYISMCLSYGDDIEYILNVWKEQKIKVFLTSETFLELQNALEYEHLQKYINEEKKEIIFHIILTKGVFVDVVSDYKVCRDIKDDIFINLAVDTMSNFIVTGDKDLLDLISFKGVKILNPGDFYDMTKSFL